jgi:V/A-type H+/Na+-transporting ATPase subunit A
MLELILTYWRKGSEAIRKGITIVRLRRMKVLQEIVRMKSEITNEEVAKITRLAARLERSVGELESIYG